MHLELMQAYKTTPRPMAIEPIRESKPIRPVLPAGSVRKAKANLPRGSVIQDFEVLSDRYFRVWYLYGTQLYSSKMKLNQNYSKVKLSQVEIDNVATEWKHRYSNRG